MFFVFVAGVLYWSKHPIKIERNSDGYPFISNEDGVEHVVLDDLADVKEGRVSNLKYANVDFLEIRYYLFKFIEILQSEFMDDAVCSSTEGLINIYLEPLDYTEKLRIDKEYPTSVVGILEPKNSCNSLFSII